LGDLLGIDVLDKSQLETEKDLFGAPLTSRQMSLSSSGGMNDYFLYNDIRNGDTTIHSWDILPTTDRHKEICLLLLRNRRKKVYGHLDGNPLSLEHLRALDKTITQEDVDELVALGILAGEDYKFRLKQARFQLTETESEVLTHAKGEMVVVDELKAHRSFKLKKIRLKETLISLVEKGALECVETRYDFKNTKISTGLNGVNRVFLPSSLIFPTLVASDTNDMVATKDVKRRNISEYRRNFIREIHQNGEIRKITKAEACLLQGFPADYILPHSRARWMKLIGNSVSVPVIEALCRAIIATSVFEAKTKRKTSQMRR
jgi:DNA (cytosine-5)-methyltransferase 1